MTHNFLGHCLLISQIIGVGPLFFVKHTDNVTRTVYNPVKFQFQVHTLYQSITIESDWINLYGPETEKQQRQDNYKAKMEEFTAAIEEIKKILNK